MQKTPNQWQVNKIQVGGALLSQGGQAPFNFLAIDILLCKLLNTCRSFYNPTSWFKCCQMPRPISRVRPLLPCDSEKVQNRSYGSAHDSVQEVCLYPLCTYCFACPHLTGLSVYRNPNAIFMVVVLSHCLFNRVG